MILLVPISPEVPKYHVPRLWPGLVLVIVLGIAFHFTYDTLEEDVQFVDGAFSLLAPTGDWSQVSNDEIISMFSKRPLLRIAPSRADWDIPRVINANFVHGGKVHLLLNLIGAFAGARICATFLPFFGVLFVFLLGGSIGIWGSMVISTEGLGYVPHVGASGGIFALMGTYYVFNFRYRTRYFFWFPSRTGRVALPTSWFFFLDVILLELVLSAAQVFPTRVDNVDHVAHVFGFGVGIILALLIRALRQWPSFIQTRAELIHWRHRKPIPAEVGKEAFEVWLQCLEINPYNDQIKFRLYDLLLKHSDRFSNEELARAFRFISPTFVRSQPHRIAHLLKVLISRKREIPSAWLVSIPYDVVIRIAKHMAMPPEEQFLLYQFVHLYRAALPDTSGFHHKLELLVRRLGGIMKPTRVPDPSDYRTGSGAEGNGPRQEGSGSKAKTAKKAF